MVSARRAATNGSSLQNPCNCKPFGYAGGIMMKCMKVEVNPRTVFPDGVTPLRAKRDVQTFKNQQVRQALERRRPVCRGQSTETLILEAEGEAAALRARQHSLAWSLMCFLTTRVTRGLSGLPPQMFPVCVRTLRLVFVFDFARLCWCMKSARAQFSPEFNSSCDLGAFMYFMCSYFMCSPCVSF